MEQLFGLNPQLLHDTVLSILAILFLFTLMSYLLFNPAKKMLKDRQERIKNDIDTARKDREEASAVKAEYTAKIKGIEKEAEEILSEARQKALKNEAKIVDEAKEEAARILKRANEEALLEKKRIMDEAKHFQGVLDVLRRLNVILSKRTHMRPFILQLSGVIRQRCLLPLVSCPPCYVHTYQM